MCVCVCVRTCVCVHVCVYEGGYSFADSLVANFHFAHSRVANSHFTNQMKIVILKKSLPFRKLSHVLLSNTFNFSQSVSQPVSQSISFSHSCLLHQELHFVRQTSSSLLRASICGLSQNGRLTVDTVPVLITTMKTNQSRAFAKPGSRRPRNKSEIRWRIGNLQVYHH